LLIGIILIVAGVILGANFKYNLSEVNFINFQISAAETESYGNYAAFNQSGVVIRGTIITPKNPRYDSSGLRPAVFFFHGLFARKEFHFHYAIELARAGFVVICPDHGGMGDSIGYFKLGWDIIPLVMTVIDHLPVLNKTYNLRINGTCVGATGHSYGGISTLYAGLYRPYNKSTGLGVSACVSIWTWANFTQTVQYMVGDFGTAPWNLLNLINMRYVLGDPYGYENFALNVAARDVIDKVNGSTSNCLPPNWLLITAWDDGLVLPEWQMEIMAAACYNNSNPSITKDKYYNDISGNITYANNFTWQKPNGNFKDGSMRKIYLPRDKYGFPMGHLTEGFLVPPLIQLLNWFGQAFNWDVSSAIARIQSESIDLSQWLSFWPDPIQGIILQMYIGPILIILGCLITLLPLISYLARGKQKDDEYQLSQFKFPKGTEFSDKDTLLFIGVFAGLFTVVTLFSLMFSETLNIQTIIPYVVADALVSGWLVRSIILGVALIFLLWFLFQKYEMNFDDIGMKINKQKLIQVLIVGAGAPLIFFGLWNLNAFTTFPTLIPMPSPTMGYWSVLELFGFILIGALVDEIYLRGLIQTKLEAKIQESTRITHNPRIKKWIGYILSVLLSLIVNSIGLFGSIIIIVGPGAFQGNISGVNFGTPFLLIGILYALIPSIISPYIYQRTRNVYACAIFTMIFLGFFFTSRLGLGVTTF